MNINDLVELDFHLRERLTFFKEQHAKHGNYKDVLRDIETVYVNRVLEQYRQIKSVKEWNDALKWYGQYQGWTK